MAPSANVASFAQAVNSGDLGLVRSMARTEPALARMPDPDCFGATPIGRAANSDNREMVDLLLELGADIDQRSDWWAGSFGVLDGCSDEMAEYLLARGATLTPHAAARLGKSDRLKAMLEQDASLVHARGGDGQTPLHFARTIEIADLLLSKGALLDALDIDHASTPANWLGGSHPRVAAHLVSKGAGTDPFLAARIGDTALLDKLIPAEREGVEVRVTRERFPTAAPAAGHIYLYTIGEGCSPAHAAAQANQPESIRWLGAHGADLNARGGYDDATPLHTAAWGDKPEAAAALIETGADINAKSGPTHRNEPVGWAIVGGSVKTFRVLVRAGARIDPHHVDDARKGAAGAFREFNPRRPLQAWREVAEVLAAR